MSNYYDQQLKKRLQNAKEQTSKALNKKKSEITEAAKELAEKEFSKNMIKATKKYHEKYGFDAKEGNKDFSTHNNEADAFKHTYMQALLCLRTGEENARYLGDMHENDGKLRNQDNGEENMDLWNNNQGREIAKEIRENYNMSLITEKAEDLVAEKVMERMKAGKLITNPNDKRRYVPKQDSPTPKLDLVKGAKTFVRAAIPPSPSLNFSNMIRQKYNSKINENNKKLKFRFNKSSGSQNSGNGRWVTMNGSHVFIEN